MIYLFDRNEQLTRILLPGQIHEAPVTEQINKPWELYATIQGDVTEAYAATRHGSGYKWYKIIKITTVGANRKIEAIEAAYDELISHGYVTDIRPADQPVRNVVDQILDGSRWTTGTVTTTKRITGNYYYQTRLACLMDLAKQGLELSFEITLGANNTIASRTVNIADQIGQNRGKRYEHGDQLLEVLMEEDRQNIVTALVGRGKGVELLDEDGAATGAYGRRLNFADVVWSKAGGDPVDKPLDQIYVEIPELTAVYGHPDGTPRFGLQEYTDVEDAEELLRITYNDLLANSAPRVTYRASVHDTGDTGLGDTVAIIRRDIGIEYQTRIYKRTYDLLRTNKVTIELGTRVESYTKRRLDTLEDQLIRQRNESRQTVAEATSAILEVMAEAYWSDSGYEYRLEQGNSQGLPAGLYSFDRPLNESPTKWVYFGAGKIVISNGKDPSGNWILKTILDGSGLGTDTVGAAQIIAGSINTDHLTATGIDAGKIRVSSTKTLTQELSNVSTLQSELKAAVQGGGRNLLTNSADEWETDRMTGGSAYGLYRRSDELSEIYKTVYEYGSGVISFEVYIENAERELGNLHVYGSNGTPKYVLGMTATTNLLTNEWVKVSHPLRITKSSGQESSRLEIWGGSSGDTTTKIKIRKVKIELGTIATAYTRAPEDIEADIAAAQARADDAVTKYTKIESGDVILGQVQDVHDRVDVTEASIAMVEGALETRVTTDLLQDQLVAIDNSLQGKANASDVSDIVAIQSIMQQTQTDWGVTISQISAEQQGHAVTLQDVRNYMRFSTAGLEVGHSDSTLSIQITNESINFIDGGEIVAYITGQTLYINSVTVLSVLQAGNHVTSAYGTDGDITVERWANG